MLAAELSMPYYIKKQIVLFTSCEWLVSEPQLQTYIDAVSAQIYLCVKVQQ